MGKKYTWLDYFGKLERLNFRTNKLSVHDSYLYALLGSNAYEKMIWLRKSDHLISDLTDHEIDR